MFPAPIQKSGPMATRVYYILLLIVLILWLLPLIAVASFSIRPQADFANGNYWGIPSAFNLFENYAKNILDRTR